METYMTTNWLEYFTQRMAEKGHADLETTIEGKLPPAGTLEIDAFDIPSETITYQHEKGKHVKLNGSYVHLAADHILQEKGGTAEVGYSIQLNAETPNRQIFIKYDILGNEAYPLALDDQEKDDPTYEIRRLLGDIGFAKTVLQRPREMTPAPANIVIDSLVDAFDTLAKAMHK